MKAQNESRSESVSKPKAKGSTQRARASGKADSPSGTDHYPREKMIEEAAYYHAKQRGFAPDNEIADWLRAEAEVDSSLRSAR